MVYATETLSLGINMPARSVILERLVKWNGESHVELTPGEYTQLTGRAGRRGIDVEGHAIVLWGTEHDAKYVAGLGEGIKSCLDAAGKSKARIVYLNGSPTDNNATLFKAGYDSVPMA